MGVKSIHFNEVQNEENFERYLEKLKKNRVQNEHRLRMKNDSTYRMLVDGYVSYQKRKEQKNGN